MEVLPDNLKRELEIFGNNLYATETEEALSPSTDCRANQLNSSLLESDIGVFAERVSLTGNHDNAEILL